jgi:hypothetical protein
MPFWESNNLFTAGGFDGPLAERSCAWHAFCCVHGIPAGFRSELDQPDTLKG